MLLTALKFRPMKVADLAAIVPIEEANFSHPWTRGNFVDSLNAGHSAWVVESAGELVAYAVLMMVLDEVHLLDISVHQACQGQGVGRQLLAHLMDVGRSHGGANMFLEVRVSNKTAIALYEQMGFNEMGIRRNYYPAKDGREDAVLMGVAL